MEAAVIENRREKPMRINTADESSMGSGDNRDVSVHTAGYAGP